MCKDRVPYRESSRAIFISVSHQVRFWNNLHQVRSRPKDWKAKQYQGVWEHQCQRV